MNIILRIKLKKSKYKMVIKFIETITINSFFKLRKKRFCKNYKQMKNSDDTRKENYIRALFNEVMRIYGNKSYLIYVHIL